MCTNFPNIRITEGNNFSIILPLLSRTYVATRPIDEAIDPQQLEINELQLKRLREEDVIRKQADLIIQLNNEGRESFLIIKNQGIAVAKNCRIIGIDKLIYDINTILPCDLLPNEEIEITITHTKDTLHQHI